MNRLSQQDVWGGMAAAAVVLPQAMAFGVSLYQGAGFNSAQGALAGLIGTAMLCLASAIIGATRGLISAPTGPSVVLLSGASITLASTGMDLIMLSTSLLSITIIAGFLQIIIGLVRGGRLVKYMPYPVISGFMTGSALLMVLSQLDQLSPSAEWQEFAAWIPAMTAVATLLCMALADRYFTQIPNTIAGLIGGSIAFQVLVWVLPSSQSTNWVIGQLPTLQSYQFQFDISMLGQLPWATILLAAAALAILSSLDTLLTAVIADVETGERHDADREMIGQGIGQALTGAFGGLAGAGTTGATLVATKTGARRWPGFTAAIVFVLLMAFGSSIGLYLATSVLAGIILYVAYSMVDRNIWTWLKRRRNRLDGGIAILVTLVTVLVDLMVAVGIGIVIALVLHIYQQMQLSIIHRYATGQQVHSVLRRPEKERQLLNTNGHRIHVYELRGSIFFATADHLYTELMPTLSSGNWIILNLQRIYNIDLTGMTILQQIASKLHQHNGRLIFCEVHKGLGLGHNVRKALRKINPSATEHKIKTFNGADEALEFAETALLNHLQSPRRNSERRIELAEHELCHQMSVEEVNALAQMLQPISVAKGEHLFRRHAPGETLYFLMQGEIDIFLDTTEHHHKRLAKYLPGTFFGEISFFNPGPRTADALVVEDAYLLSLERSGFEQLLVDFPQTSVALLLALGQQQGRALMWSTDEIQRLSEW